MCVERPLIDYRRGVSKVSHTNAVELTNNKQFVNTDSTLYINVTTHIYAYDKNYKFFEIHIFVETRNTYVYIRNKFVNIFVCELL